jgi:uncharacterized C2H2 Zn-finger protein
MNVHQKTVTHSCEVCMQTFAFKTGLDKHKKLNRCKGPPEKKSLADELDKDQMAQIAKQQLLEISKQPSPVIDDIAAEALEELIGFHPMDDDLPEDPDFNSFPFKIEELFEEFGASEVETGLEFICDLCSKSHKTKKDLLLHLKAHCGFTHKCTLGGCGYTTNISSEYDAHLKTHHLRKKPPIKCPKCSKVFKKQNEMTRHLNAIHSNVKTYVMCPECEKIILEQSLKSHIINQHTEIAKYKPFECKVCGKRERYQKNLDRHYNSVHDPKSRGVIYQCPDCPASFFRQRDLNTHSFEHFTGKIHTCEECNSYFKSKGELTGHKKMHSNIVLQCSHCEQVFKTKSGLSKHLKKHV